MLKGTILFVYKLCFQFSLFVWWYRNSIRLMLYITVILNKSPLLQFAIQCIKWFVIWCILLVIISSVGCVFSIFVTYLYLSYYSVTIYSKRNYRNLWNWYNKYCNWFLWLKKVIVIIPYSISVFLYTQIQLILYYLFKNLFSKTWLFPKTLVGQ